MSVAIDTCSSNVQCYISIFPTLKIEHIWFRISRMNHFSFRPSYRRQCKFVKEWKKKKKSKNETARTQWLPIKDKLHFGNGSLRLPLSDRDKFFLSPLDVFKFFRVEWSVFSGYRSLIYKSQVVRYRMVFFLSLTLTLVGWWGCCREDAIYRFVSERNYPHCAHKEICISRCLPCTMGPLKCPFFFS